MMAEFAGGLEDSWGLQSIIGGGGGGGGGGGPLISTAGAFCSSISSAVAVSGVPNSKPFYGVMDEEMGYPHDLFCESATTRSDQTLTDELEGLINYYKPLTSPVFNSGSSSPADSVFVGDQEKCEETGTKHKKQTVEGYVPKYKKRKNQQKRVMLQVTAEDLSSDMWAWRKYGQKPIKGSPYPRSYYRCSSTKGCLARRQVEQSCKDPSVFIVTYAGEHNHSQPTRKNALAGTIRHKFPANSKCPSAQPPVPSQQLTASSSPTSSSSTSINVAPVGSPLIGNSRNAGVVKQERMIMEETGGEVIKMDGINTAGKDDNVIFSGMKLDDEFFSGLEDIDDLISELSGGYCCSTKQHFPTP